MTKEQMFRLRLINRFNFVPIIADAIVDLSKDFLLMMILEFVLVKFFILPSLMKKVPANLFL